MPTLFLLFLGCLLFANGLGLCLPQTPEEAAKWQGPMSRHSLFVVNVGGGLALILYNFLPAS